MTDQPTIDTPARPPRPSLARRAWAFLRNTWRGLTSMRTALVLLFLRSGCAARHRPIQVHGSETFRARPEVLDQPVRDIVIHGAIITFGFRLPSRQTF